MQNGIFIRLKRKIAFLLAFILAFQPFFNAGLGLLTSQAAEEGRGSVYAYYDSSNLLKPGASFPFYGKDHNRVGLWPYGITNVEDGKPAAGFCLEPNKSMRTGTQGTIVSYDLDTDGDNLPFGMSREEAEILWYALSSSGNFEGYQSNVGKMGQGHYILGQAAAWAIMSGRWNGLEDFREQMEVLMANLKSPTLAAQTRGALEQFFNQTNEAVEALAVPPFASKYKSNAPIHKMHDNGDGTYSLTLEYSEGHDWRQSQLVFDVPEGWSVTRDEKGVTFVCTTGNPDIGLVRGHFEENSAGAKYWVKPNTFKVWYPDGWEEGSAVEGKQAMITMAGKQETWEVWLAFGKGDASTVTGSGSGDYEIPYTQYLHEETFKRDYKIELEKRCDETGKTLEHATFEVLEQFDFTQLDGTNLEEEQFTKNTSYSEGRFEDLSVCQSEITTDENGHFEHTDQKRYNYEKTYCGGHPDPIIHYVEVGDDASEEEEEEAEEENARREREAWAAWQKCVDWCEENCDFHSIEEGVAREAMREDRDEAWDTFIHLKRIYTIREILARKGYILHDLHNDDEPIEIVEFMSSQVEDDGRIIGYYAGNKGAASSEDAELTSVSISQNKTDLVKAAATSSDVEVERLEEFVESGNENGKEERKEEPEKEIEAEEEKKESERETEEDEDQSEIKPDEDETKLESELESEIEEELENDLLPSTGSNAIKIENPASASNAMFFQLNRPMLLSEDDEEEGGSWTWDGVQEGSEVEPIAQNQYPADYTGYSYLVKDHRTEGELHINKRDMELYNQDAEGSYGQIQGDATLEGAVYGLYAAEDIVHPDGKTGVVFSKGELVAITSTDKQGDASFLVITEVSETSKKVPNLYAENEEKNGNAWIGRPLILGSYYVEELSRSEGYELSVTGKNLTESNRKGKPVILTESGSAHTEGFFHRINEWEEDSYDFKVSFYNTKGFDILLGGLPANAKLYEVTEQTKEKEESVIIGSKREEKTDGNGNVIYQTANGGEYKLDADGNRILKRDENGEIQYSDQPVSQTVTAVNRLNFYLTSIEREEPSDPDLESSEDIDPDYILWETSAALAGSGYKNGLTEAPWKIVELSGSTNGEIIEEILSECASDSFWDAYDVEEVFEKNGTWYAKIRYAYKALKGQPAIYEPGTGRLIVRNTYDGGYYYVIYNENDYEKQEYRFTITKKELDQAALNAGNMQLKTVFAPLYEQYEAGEYLLDGTGQKIPVMETVPEYGTQVVAEQKETLTAVPVSYDRENSRLRAHVDTEKVDFSDETYVTRIYRVVTEDKISKYPSATVNVTTKKAELDVGSYVKHALLSYPGQYEIYEDAGTREKPVQVFERVIKQAIKVTKDIALDSYEHNTYEIHRDPFTVLFGGYNGKQETKTLPGFYFKLYLRSDLEETGLLKKKEDGSFDYEKFFKENPSYETSMALEWDIEKYDSDQDMTTVHANRGGGKDDYWGESRMMPYGVYVLVEQQPTGIPQKAYQIDSPKEVEIPFIPKVDEDGTVHDKIPSEEYLYDSAMTPEELAERYKIRFNEESHVIYAHNNDGDFEVFKYGLEPDSSRDCQNETVAAYYHYGSISEDAGKQDGVYYETYYDRDGTITDYGVTLDEVDTMTGKSTAVDRKFAKALIPWSVLEPRYGEVINDDGDVGNRDAGLDEDGTFNFVAFSHTDFENEFYSSRLRIEKLDAETGENILHDGAFFKIYAAKRDISGDGADRVTGSGDVLFDENGIPLYDESEQIFMQDDSGAEVGIFKAYTTVRDGEVTGPDGTVHTEKQCVGYLETYQPLGSGAYVLVEVLAPEGYVKSKPIAFTVYSDKVEYYEKGDPDKKVLAVKYQYMRPVGSDGKTEKEDMHQIVVKDKPTHIEIHKIENSKQAVTYRVEGDEAQLRARGDVELQYKPNGEFAGFGFVTRTLRDDSEPKYVANATLTLYEGLEVKKTGEHSYEGVEVKRNLFDSVIRIRATETGVDSDIRKTGTDSSKREEWDITEVKNPPVDLWYFDLEYDPTELDEETGILYGLDDWGNRICMLDSETGMAYVTDESGAIIVWPLDEHGDKIISQSVEVYTDENGNPAINMDLQPVTDENGLPIYYKDGGVTWLENEWVTDDTGAFELSRVKQGAYILEETAAPLADGYVQSIAIGIRVKDVSEMQSFYMEDDYTKLEVSKLDMTSREEIEGATLTLYEAYRVYDDSDRGWHLEILKDTDGEPVVAETWVSEGGKPHWIDHIMPGDYILRETRVPTAAGYVTSEDVEVIIKETGEVQGFVMEDDHTAMEVRKVDAVTGKPLDQDHRATLALYQAVVNAAGEVQYDENGIPLYEEEKKIHEWQTDDGSAVRKTAHQVTIDGGHTYTAYDYDMQKVSGTVQAICYVTETGAMRFEYLPVGKYVLVEEQAPSGYTKADPLYIPILDVGKNTRVQQFTMEDQPLKVLLTKVNVTGGKEIAGATISIYRAKEDGTLAKYQMKDDAGNLLYVTDLDGNFLTDEAGNLIPAMEYDENYLVERWISGSDGTYSKKDLENGVIPEGYEVGDLRIHEMKEPKTGLYYFVEEQTPFGYVRASELPFEVVDTMEIQKLELVDELMMGQLEIIKSDKADASKFLGGAKFKFTNLDTHVTTILITDEEGRAVSSQIPIGTVGKDGAVSLYHFSVQEVDAPDGYFLDPAVHEFQFNVNTDRYAKLVYHYEAKDEKNKVRISKKALTTKEELPGAKLEIRPVKEITDENGQIVKQEGEVIESWISTDKPYEIEGLMSGTYVLIETRAPEGYLEAEKVYFAVKENMTAEEIPLVEMFDDDTKTEIIKVDEETKEPLAGVKLKLLREDSMETVKEWVTDETGSIQFMGLPAGNYLVQEIEAPEGYQLLDEPMQITIRKDYKLQTFMVNNRKIEVRIEKRDLEDREFVEGAVLRLLDEQGNVAAQWTTKKEPEILKGLKAGRYTLEEVKAPEGYLLMKEPMELEVKSQAGVQTVTVLNQKLEVDILKKDKESGELLPGARLRLIRNADSTVIREWISSGVAEVLKGLVPGSYTLEEVAAPSGYAIADKLIFEVTGTEEKQKVAMNNEKIITDYEKIDSVTGEPVAGASLQLIQNAGTKEEKVVAAWISDGKPMRFTGISAGTYVIREVAAPEGYVPMKDMAITIVPDQVLQSFMVKNQPIQAEIEKTGDNSSTRLGGAVLQLVRNSDGKIIREWTSKEDQAEHFSKLEPGIYTIREVKAPSGYKKIEPKEIEIKAVEEIQGFEVRNYKITHSGGGGGSDRPKPESEYMELYKVDGTTGERLSGAVITVYHPDGTVYFEGTTGPSGTIRFKKPGTGQYTFAETKEPDGYFRNENVFTFTIQPNGSVAGDTEIMDYKKPELIISKKDVTTSEELPGAEIEITDKDGNPIYTGISDENGKVFFEVPKPGEYHFKEITAPEGYDRNETVFSFTVFEDGTIIGDHTITDQKHYGRITASYETKRKGEGDVTIGELIHAPKTGDSSHLGLIFLCWLASVSGLVYFIFRNWKNRKKSGFGKKAGSKLGIFLIVCIMTTGMSAMKVQAAEAVLENLYEEHQYTTENPDSDEAEKLFEKELERDGITYRLSEIRTEVVKKQGESAKDTLELTTSPFLEKMAEKQKPEEQIERDGVTYQLVTAKLENYKIPAHEIPVKEEVLYEAVESKDVIPSKIKVSVADEATGQTMETIAELSHQTMGEQYWSNDFSFLVTFHEYGLDGYWLGDQVFKLNEEQPDFHGYETELLKLIEVNPNDYSVEAATWNGEAYQDTDGVLCRDATVTGKKLVSDCTVTYEGKGVFSETDGVRYCSSYQSANGESGAGTVYTMKATGVYVPKKGNPAAVAAVLGLTAAGAGSIGAVWYRKKKQKPKA